MLGGVGRREESSGGELLSEFCRRRCVNAADRSKSVQIAIKARESYKSADGSQFTPILEIRCEEAESGKRSLTSILATGGRPRARRWTLPPLPTVESWTASFGVSGGLSKAGLTDPASVTVTARGPLTIEREIPEEAERQKAEIGQAIALLNGLKAKIG